MLLAGLFAGRAARDVTYLVAMATLVVTAWLAAGGAGTAVATTHGSALVADPLAQLLKLFALAVTALVFAYSRPFLRDRGLDAGDFYVLGLFALLGILVMVSAGSFLVMYLGLETLALALYAMVAVERDAPVGAEAAMKYSVLGAIASGCLLYGISIVYGVTADELATAIERLLEDPVTAERLGRRGREIFESRFTLEQSMARVMAFYQQAVLLNGCMPLGVESARTGHSGVMEAGVTDIETSKEAESDQPLMSVILATPDCYETIRKNDTTSPYADSQTPTGNYHCGTIGTYAGPQ